MKMENRLSGIVMGIVIFVTLIVPSMAFAQGKILLGPLKYADTSDEIGGKFNIKPTANVSARYDSNYFKDNNNERAVATYAIRPGIRLGYQTAKASIDLGYSLDIYFYDDIDDVPAGQPAASEDDYVGHTFELLTRYSPTNKITLGLDDSFYLTREPGDYDPLTGQVSDRRKYYVNRFNPSVKYLINEYLSTTLGYKNTFVDYDEDSLEDSTEHMGIFDLQYSITPTASIGVSYNYIDKNYDVDVSDYTAHLASLIFKKEAKFLYFEAGLGYNYRDYKNDKRGTYDIPTVRLALKGQTSGLDEGPAKTWAMLTFEHNFNMSGVSENFIEVDQFVLKGGHVFIDKIITDIQLYIRSDDYKDFQGITENGGYDYREDDSYGITASVGYRFAEWLTARLRGGYENRDSNLADYSYDNKFVMLSLESNLDMWDTNMLKLWW